RLKSLKLSNISQSQAPGRFANPHREHLAMWPRGHTLQATAGMPPADVRPPTGDITGEAVAKLKKAPRALAPELVRASRVWEEYYVISIESEDVNMRIRKNIVMTLAITLIATAPAWSQSLLKTLDPDHDGTVDLAETKSAASKLFDKLDRDHDGTLDKRELRGRLNAKDFAAADPDN